MSDTASIEPELADFFDPDILEDPAEWYGQAHVRAPILRTADGTHLVLSHELVSEAADRPEDFSSSFGSLMSGQRREDEEIFAISSQGWPVVDTMLTADDPVHARYRRLVNLAFTMPRVNALEGQIREIANGLLDDIAPNTPTDFMSAFAVPLPVTLIAEQIGLDRSAAPLVKRWSDASTNRHSGLISREQELECAREMLEFQRFLKQKIDERRANPETGDLLCAIVNASVEGEKPLQDAEIMSVFQQLMVAGNETTTSTLAGGLVLWSRHPDQAAKVRANPALLRPMIEEMLRLLSPTAGMWRFATRDTMLGGVRIAAGERLMLRFAAANRDPTVFTNPDRFDVERTNVNRHMAFGRGIHTCVGNMLARKELALAFDEIMKRFKSVEIVETDARPRHHPHKLLHGLASLEVVLQA